MVSSHDSHIIELWLESQASPHTRGCYRRDAARLLAHVSKPLSRISLGDLQSFAQSLVQAGLAPISRARTLAAVKSLFGFCQRMRYVSTNPAAELSLPGYDPSRPVRSCRPERQARHGSTLFWPHHIFSVC
jgi:site-specific recombinase XerD